MSLQTEMQATLLTLTSAASAKNMSEADYLDYLFSLIEGGGATTDVDAVISAATTASRSLAVTELGVRKTAAVAIATGSTAASAALPAAKLVVIDSAASSGGSATETLTFTGMLGTDTILALTQKVVGANSVALRAFGSPATNTLSVTFTGDPGASAIVRALVKKA